MYFNMPKDEGTLQELVDQFHLIEERLQAARDAKRATPTPQAAP